MGNWGVITHTTDGGATWTDQDTPVGVLLWDVYFTSPLNGWAAGGKSTLLHTVDGGVTWTNMDDPMSPFEHIFYDMSFVNENVFTVSGENPTFRTKDGGASWITQKSGTGISKGVHFVDENNGLLIKSWGQVWATTNGGTNWFNQFTTPSGNWLYDVFFIDENRGWIVGDPPAPPYFTLDGGATWNADPDLSGLLIRDIDFVDADHGWAIGPNFILKYVPAGSTDTVSEELPFQSTLRSNYPNPFNPETMISYSLGRSGRVKLTIYNLLGELVETLVDGVQPPGEHSTSFKASDIASGIYLFTLTTGDYSQTRQMVLLK